MSRTKGSPKTGGRIKGMPNKRTLIFQEALDYLGVDILARLAELLPTLEPAKRADVLLQLMAYQYPKRKAVEVTSSTQASLPVLHIWLPDNGRTAQDGIL